MKVPIAVADDFPPPTERFAVIEVVGFGFEEIDVRKCMLIRASNKAFLTGVLVFLAGANASTVAVMMLL